MKWETRNLPNTPFIRVIRKSDQGTVCVACCISFECCGGISQVIGDVGYYTLLFLLCKTHMKEYNIQISYTQLISREEVKI